MIGLVTALAAASLPLIEHPDWIKSPTASDFAEFYPKAALDDGVAGHVTLECIVPVDGYLRDCKPSEETPPSYGFADAGVGLIGRFQVRPMQVGGRAVEARLQIKIRFTLPPEPPMPTMDEAVGCVATLRASLEKDPTQKPVWKELDFWIWSMDQTALRQKIRPSDLGARIQSRTAPAVAPGRDDGVAGCHATMSSYIARWNVDATGPKIAAAGPPKAGSATTDGPPTDMPRAPSPRPLSSLTPNTLEAPAAPVR